MGRAETITTWDEQTLHPVSGSGSTTHATRCRHRYTRFHEPGAGGGATRPAGSPGESIAWELRLSPVLTGEVAFAGPDVGLVLQRSNEVSLVRRADVDPTIPAPLESICLKQLASSRAIVIVSLQSCGRRRRTVDRRRTGIGLSRSWLSRVARWAAAAQSGHGGNRGTPVDRPRGRDHRGLLLAMPMRYPPPVAWLQPNEAIANQNSTWLVRRWKIT